MASLVGARMELKLRPRLLSEMPIGVGVGGQIINPSSATLVLGKGVASVIQRLLGLKVALAGVRVLVEPTTAREPTASGVLPVPRPAEPPPIWKLPGGAVFNLPLPPIGSELAIGMMRSDTGKANPPDTRRRGEHAKT